MSRLRWLPVLMALILFATPAKADGIDVKVKGQWDFAFGWTVHSSMRDNDKGENDDSFGAAQRVRTQINFVTSEYLQAVLMFEIGDLAWGQGNNMNGRAGQGAGGGLDADGVNVETKRAYLDWVVPNTELSLRMGIQGIALPMATWDNPVFSADVAGIVASYQFCDLIGASLFWARPFDRYNDGDNRNLSDEMDMFGLILPITGEDWSVTPWGVYSRIGSASGFYNYITDIDEDELAIGMDDGKKHANAWWLGVAAEASILEPLTFGFNAMYGRVNNTELSVSGTDPDTGNDFSYNGRFATSGWFISASLDYELEWGVPGIFGWYASGDDENALDSGRFGRMPVVGLDDGFTVTSFGFPGTYSIGSDTLVTASGMGTWGIGVQLADMSFIEDLSHTLRFAYYRGTNDHEIVKNNSRGSDGILMFCGESQYLTDKDYVLEVNFDHSYQIYENLLAVIELGWLKLNLDDATWEDHDTTSAWKAQVMFEYSF